MRNLDTEPSINQAYQSVQSMIQDVITGKEKEVLICRVTPVGEDDSITFPFIFDGPLSFGRKLRQIILREIGVDMTDNGLLSTKRLSGNRWVEEVYSSRFYGVNVVVHSIDEGNQALFIRNTIGRPS